MPRIPFQKPKKVEWEELSERYGRLVAEPFEKGYALTVGNSLRRTLLSIIPGAAVSWVRIDGVPNVEAPIPGVAESTIDVLLNFKKLAIQVPSGEPRVLRLDVQGPKAVTGADLPEVDVEIINPELPLFTIEEPVAVSIEVGVGVGRGYEAADRMSVAAPAGAMALDAAYSPITRVSYNVEMSRLGKITDYEKLVLEIWTNGEVGPDEALARAATHLRDHFTPLAPARTEGEDDEADAAREGFFQESLGKPIEDLPLPARAVNALRNAEIALVADLVQKTDHDLANVKNLGDKSIEEIKTVLAKHLSTQPASFWLEKLHAKDLWAMEVLDWGRLTKLEAYKCLQMEQTLTTSQGQEITTTRCPIRINGERIFSPKPAPQLGEHNETINKELIAKK
jgi:DNA-directed RNA polymerase subunit alpha